ncbi:uncharacterized protein CC84DRAFT_792688 [Paraphaeosphaeria sporulosa]|uniref:Uncharacterized protein n=1 Tax=Paraphaeosphaeria sporulosa TaxID=1460663 RepID=A0A177CCB8_9PLEO|nr:uncharacterized protein CC84DRAFT_792688 [Paraphaeosphaeria sporulosa]OAG04439.1 hypothetical protein CC84DRAFT_792688 [Paraphaeosphaeria sporulosa]
MGTLRQSYNSPPRNPLIRKAIRHVHFEDEARSRPRQHKPTEKTYHHVDVEKDDARGRTRYRYRSRSRSRSRNRSRGQRTPTLHRYYYDNEQRRSSDEWKCRPLSYRYPNMNPYENETQWGEDRRHKHMRYLRDINEARTNGYCYHPVHEYGSSRSSYHNKSWTKENAYDHLPRRTTYTQYDQHYGSYDRHYSPKDGFCKYGPFLSSRRSSPWPSPMRHESYSCKRDLYNPKYEYHRYQSERSRSRYETTPNRCESSRRCYFRRSSKSQVPEICSTRRSWRSVHDRSIDRMTEGDDSGGFHIHIRHRRWM